MSEPSWKKAERILGCRLDRRMTYTIGENNEVWLDVRMTGSCSGCTPYEESAERDHRGGGCSECGYQGRTKTVWGIPLGPGGRVIDSHEELLTHANL